MQQFAFDLSAKDGKAMTMEVRQKHPRLNKRRVKTWTNEEDAQLLTLYEQHPKHWADIAALMQDRNQNQCLHRYRRLSQLGRSHKIWSSEEDETILKLIKKYGKNWKLLSEMLGTKNGKQIRERFINKLDPRIKKEDWTDEEDKKILELFSQVGSKWSEISKHLPGRPQNKIKNRFYSFIQKNYDIRFKEKTIAVVEEKALSETKLGEDKGVNICEQPNDCRDEEQLFSGLQIPSINDIEMEMRPDIMSNNNWLSSVVKVEEDWQNYNPNNYSQSIFDLQSNDFFKFNN